MSFQFNFRLNVTLSLDDLIFAYGYSSIYGIGSVDIVFSGETCADAWIEKEVRNVVDIL